MTSLDSAARPVSRSAATALALPSWRLQLLVLIAGCAHAFSIAWPFHFGSALGLGLDYGQAVWWLQPLSLVALVWSLQSRDSVGQAAWLGGLFATAMQSACWWWLFISLHTYGGLAAPLAVLAIVGLAAFLGLYYAAACAAYLALGRGRAVGRAWLFAALWLMAELARVQFFTGFPWGEGGYAQLDGPFVSLAKLVGVHGLSFGAALFAAGLAGLLHQPRRLAAAQLALGVLLALVVSWSVAIGPSSMSRFSVVTPQTQALSVTLLQGNIAQDQKFEASGGIPDALKWYGNQLMSSQSSLIVTPETALPLLPAQLPSGYLETLLQRFSQPPAADQAPMAALIGIPLGSSQSGYTNSVIGFKPAPPQATAAESIYRYDKHHLVPFGEFVHPLFKWFLALVNIPLSDFSRGDVSQPSFDWQGQRIALNICYEDLFGEDLAVRFKDRQSAPTLLLNVSNIGWFGDTIAVAQHLNISRMRAIEFERPMLRATNTGATALIDYRGQVVQSLAPHTRGALVVQVQGRDGITPYAWWVARLQLWPWWLLGIGLTVLAWLGRRRV
jgi:apolipoprotein N-acyltransferase